MLYQLSYVREACILAVFCVFSFPVMRDSCPETASALKQGLVHQSRRSRGESYR